MVAVPKTKSAASGRTRHFLFTWLKTHGIDDALIQPYSGHASRTSACDEGWCRILSVMAHGDLMLAAISGRRA